MKKILIICVLGLVLTSCKNYDVNELIAESVNNSRYHLIAENNNNNKKYYSYYLDANVGKVKTNQISSVFKVNESEFVMNLKVNAIVNNSYFENINISEISSDNIIVNDSSTYVDRFEKVMPFDYMVVRLEDNRYYVELTSKYLQFSGIAYETDVDKLIKEMIVIAQSVIVDEEKIISDYSVKTEIDYEKKNIDLFQRVIPEEGRLDEMMGIDVEEVVGDNLDEDVIDYREIVNGEGTTGLDTTTDDSSDSSDVKEDNSVIIE